MSRLHAEQLDRAKRAVKDYVDLIEYWRQPQRYPGKYKSVNLDQSQEFIDERIRVCTIALQYWGNRVSLLGN